MFQHILKQKNLDDMLEFRLTMYNEPPSQIYQSKFMFPASRPAYFSQSALREIKNEVLEIRREWLPNKKVMTEARDG